MATLAQLVSSLLSVLNCKRSAPSSGQLIYLHPMVDFKLINYFVCKKLLEFIFFYVIHVIGTCCMCILWGWILLTVWLQPETLRLKSSSWVERILAVSCPWVKKHIHIYLYMSKMYYHYMYILILTTTLSTAKTIIIIIINIVL